MRNELLGVVSCVLLLAVTYLLVYLQVTMTKTDPVDSGFFGVLTAPMAAAAFGALALGFSREIKGLFTPGSSAKMTARELAIPGAELGSPMTTRVTLSDKLRVLGWAVPAGFGGGLILLYIGFSLLPGVQDTVASGFAISATCFGGGIVLIALGIYAIIRVFRY